MLVNLLCFLSFYPIYKILRQRKADEMKGNPIEIFTIAYIWTNSAFSLKTKSPCLESATLNLGRKMLWKVLNLFDPSD